MEPSRFEVVSDILFSITLLKYTKVKEAIRTSGSKEQAMDKIIILLRILIDRNRRFMFMKSP
ncbi:hypothetical protein D3C72_1387900 [compost metagenome]